VILNLPKAQISTNIFDQARTLIDQSQATQDVDLLSEGLRIMRSSVEACRRIDNGANITVAGLRRIRSAVSYKENIEAYRKDKTNRVYFGLLLSNFIPEVTDITHKKHRREIDTLLVKSLISHDNGNGCNNYKLKSQDFDALLNHLGKVGSGDAFACVLDECLRRLHEQSWSSRVRNEINVQLLTFINRFDRNDLSLPALPHVILDVIAKYPERILAEQRKYPNSDPGALRMGVLKAMFDRYGGNETMMDVTLEVVSNSLYRMQDHRQLLWAEQMGVNVDIDRTRKNLSMRIGSDDLQVASLYYLLSSPRVSTDTLIDTLTHIVSFIDAPVYKISLMTAADLFNANGQGDELFVDKAILLLKHLLVKDMRTGKGLLERNVLPAKRLMKDHQLRDYLMGTDLGL